ncbi:hypothetical protein HAX54_009633 [Datura stramonium]|uniref:Uncharacterized protein n=1 Tax=Datura stramonium TaxID=4076 RepID=A0ABS8TGS7_DATST|nr:hypothetical protein [Datura stramonium]
MAKKGEKVLQARIKPQTSEASNERPYCWIVTLNRVKECALIKLHQMSLLRAKYVELAVSLPYSILCTRGKSAPGGGGPYDRVRRAFRPLEGEGCDWEEQEEEESRLKGRGQL